MGGQFSAKMAISIILDLVSISILFSFSHTLPRDDYTFSIILRVYSIPSLGIMFEVSLHISRWIHIKTMSIDIIEISETWH